MSTSIAPSLDFERQVDGSASRLVEAYRVLLRGAQIESTSSPQVQATTAASKIVFHLPPHIQIQLSTAASEIVYHSHALVDKINELRMQLVLQDEETVHEEEQFQKVQLEKKLP